MPAAVAFASDPNTNAFYMDPSDILGLEYQAYVSYVRAQALGNPKNYFELRRVVLAKVKTDAIKDLYGTIFNVLSMGRDKLNKPIGELGNSEEMTPRYPSNKINEFAIAIVRDLSNHLDRVVDIILPDDFEKLAEGKTTLKGLGDIIGN